jgi:plastocyanin
MNDMRCSIFRCLVTWPHLPVARRLRPTRLLRSFGALASGAGFVLTAAPAVAYEVVPVTNGGRLTVQVVHEGKAVVNKEKVDRDQTFCGTEITSHPVTVGPAGQLADVIVYLADIARGKAPDTTAVARLDNRGCHFVPRVQSVTVGQTLQIVNSDPILHSTHAKAGNRTVFNLALPTEGQVIPKKIRAAGLMHVRCDAGHTWMNAWIDAFAHPYHAVTGADGQAQLTDIPPGTYQVTAWHETLGEETQPVKIEAGKAATVRFAHLVPAGPSNGKPEVKP